MRYRRVLGDIGVGLMGFVLILAVPYIRLLCSAGRLEPRDDYVDGRVLSRPR